MVTHDEIRVEVTLPHNSIGANITSLSGFVSPYGTKKVQNLS